MWLEILCGLVCFRLFRRFFVDEEDDLLQIDGNDSRAILFVANRAEKIYGGKAYVGLRIPDADSGSRQNIDIVLVTKGGATLIAVRNLSGFVDMDKEGNWVYSSEKRHKAKKHPNPCSLMPSVHFMDYICVSKSQLAY